MTLLEEVINRLSAEWQKPKAKNLITNGKKVIDSRTPRDYKKIKRLQKRKSELKGS